MKRAILASGNAHKLEEIQDVLKDFNYELVTMKSLGFTEEIVEDGDTFEANSLIKAKAVQKALGGVVIADDSGLEVDYLNGAPGVYSARYAGEHCSYEDNNTKLLQALEGVEDEQRTARFVTVITMLFEDGSTIVTRGEVEGQIGHKRVGTNGFGYDPLFIVPELNKTFAELLPEEKNAMSHRSRALVKLKERL